MAYVLFFAILLLGLVAAHFLASFVFRKTRGPLYVFNAFFFLLFIILYIILVAWIEAQIFGSSGIYDVALIYSIVGALVGSAVSAWLQRKP